MVSPVSNATKSFVTAPDSQRQNNLSQKYNEYASINVEFSEQAKKTKMFEEGSPLVEVIKSEFNQVFELINDRNKN